MARPILAIGGAVIDRTFLCTNEPSPGTSNPVTSRRSFGGVARNVAEGLARLGARVRLISAIGRDVSGQSLAAALKATGVEIAMLEADEHPTAEYTAAFWQGELFAGFADMQIFDTLTPEAAGAQLPANLGEWLVFADCNLPQATLASLARRAAKQGFRLAIDAVSLSKSERLPYDLSPVAFLFLNGDQARHLGGPDTLIARGARALVLTQGAAGVTVLANDTGRHLPAPSVPVASVSGAGDALISGTLLALAEDRPLLEAVRYGLAASALALQIVGSVPPDLSRARLDAELARLPST